MILLLDTSTPTCRITLVKDRDIVEDQWTADRQLAKGLLAHMYDTLEGRGSSLSDVSSLGVYRGPGSFTGLRIGMTVMNTLSDALHIPIVGATGDNWKNEAIGRLLAGENDNMVLPLYGSDATITKPRK